MRNCPKCGIPMPSSIQGEQEVERCEECSGIFLDKGELDSIINLIEIYRYVELDEPDIQTLADVERPLYRCPSEGANMLRKEYLGVTVDECSECGGVWLDDGEITTLKTTESHIKENLNLYIRLGK